MNQKNPTQTKKTTQKKKKLKLKLKRNVVDDIL